MTFKTPNFLIYPASLVTLGDLPDDTTIVEALSRLDFLVVDLPPDPFGLAHLNELINAANTIRPTLKVFGRVEVGGALDVPTVKAAIDTWVAAAPGLLTGIYADHFCFGTGALATRDTQNQVVNYAHGLSLGVMTDDTNAFSLFEPYPAMAAGLFARDITNRDYLVVDGLFAKNAAPAIVPTPELVDHRLGRVDYLHAAIDTLGGTPLNVGLLAQVGAGEQTILEPTAMAEALRFAGANRFDGIGWAPNDGGALTHRIFLQGKANTLPA